MAVLDGCFYEGVAEIDDGNDELNVWHDCLSNELFIGLFMVLRRNVTFFATFRAICPKSLLRVFRLANLVVTTKKLQTLAGVAAS